MGSLFFQLGLALRSKWYRFGYAFNRRMPIQPRLLRAAGIDFRKLTKEERIAELERWVGI